MPHEKPAFFVEFFRNPLTEAYPEVFQPLGDGIELTRWWLGHDDPRRCSLFSLFAIRHENRWGLDAVRNSVSDVDTRIYLGVIALEDENDLRDWFDAFVDRMNASIPLNADFGIELRGDARGCMAVGGQGGVALMPKGFLPSLQSARVVELLSVGAGAILLGTLGLLFWAAFLGGLAVLFACYGIAALFRSARSRHPKTCYDYPCRGGRR